MRKIFTQFLGCTNAVRARETGQSVTQTSAPYFVESEMRIEEFSSECSATAQTR